MESMAHNKYLSLRIATKPIDAAALQKAAEETGALVSVEEHNIIGGWDQP